MIDALFAEPGASRLEDPEVVQPVLFSIQVALAALWRSWGVVPDVVVGHSFGEIAAAVVAGAIAIEEGVRVVCARGRLTQRRAGHGGVAIVELPLETVETLLLAYPTLEVGGENGPTTTVVTGGIVELEALVGALAERDVFARRVRLGYASHSRDMDVLLDDFAAAIDPLETNATEVRFCSTVLGGIAEAASLGPDYWVRNLRAPVRFADAVRFIGGAEPSVFLEIGPHPVLTTALKQNLDGGSGVLAVLPSLQRGRPSLTTLDDSLGRLYAAGCDSNWAGRYPRGTVVSTPTYPWQRERMWIDVPRRDGAAPLRQREHPLLGRRVENAGLAHARLGADDRRPGDRLFRDHLLQGVPSASTSAMVEMVVAAASRTLGTEALELFDIELRRALVLPREGTYRVQTLLDPRVTSGPRRFEAAPTNRTARGARTPQRASGSRLPFPMRRGSTRLSTRSDERRSLPRAGEPRPSVRSNLPGDRMAVARGRGRPRVRAHARGPRPAAVFLSSGDARRGDAHRRSGGGMPGALRRACPSASDASGSVRARLRSSAPTRASDSTVGGMSARTFGSRAPTEGWSRSSRASSLPIWTTRSSPTTSPPKRPLGCTTSSGRRFAIHRPPNRRPGAWRQARRVRRAGWSWPTVAASARRSSSAFAPRASRPSS